MNNELTVKTNADSAVVAAETGRAVTEVHGQFEMARRYPRDINAALSRLHAACRNQRLALEGSYLFPRGGNLVSDISIRMAEVLATSWGNIDFGIVEMEQRDGESTMMCYALDLESNTRVKKVFVVKHERQAYGKTVKLTQARDVYELTANLGSRRLRACILQVIPSWYKEEAKEACDATIYNSEEEISKRMPKMITSYSKYGVSEAMIEKRVGKPIDEVEIADFVILTRIFLAIKDGMAQVGDYFDTSLQKKSDMKKALSKSSGKKNEPGPETMVSKLKTILNDPDMQKIIATVCDANGWPDLVTDDEETAQLYLDEIEEVQKTNIG